MIPLSLHAPNARVRLIVRPVLIGSVPDLVHFSVLVIQPYGSSRQDTRANSRQS